MHVVEVLQPCGSNTCGWGSHVTTPWLEPTTSSSKQLEGHSSNWKFFGHFISENFACPQQKTQTQINDEVVSNIKRWMQFLTEGTWCSGITSASHAEGPGFNPQCVHFSQFYPLRTTRFILHPKLEGSLFLKLQFCEWPLCEDKRCEQHVLSIAAFTGLQMVCINHLWTWRFSTSIWRPDHTTSLQRYITV